MTNIPYLTQEASPAVEPVSLAETKLYLRVDGNNEDQAITKIIFAVRRVAEQYMRRSLITQSWRLSFDEYAPAEVYLPRGPVQSISNVKIIARDGTETTLLSSGYYLDAGKENLVFDATPIGHIIRITYVAGYGDANSVPEDIKQAILSHITVMFENRGGETSIPAVTRSIYENYRIVHI